MQFVFGEHEQCKLMCKHVRKKKKGYSGKPLTRALKGFFLRLKPAFWWTSINRYHGFSRFGREKILSPFREHSKEYVGV